MGLANRLAEPGRALEAALELCHQLAAFPQGCLRSDRRSAYEQWGLSLDDALRREFALGYEVLRSGESAAGAARFSSGEGRHGAFG
jgi:enoyl-CoA hydratase